MKCIIGLGNPGKQYRLTRHNIGFQVIDYLADKHRITLKSGAGEYLYGEHRSGRYALMKPLTSMNNSGNALMQLQQHKKVKPKQMLVIYDDLDLPLGRMRFRPNGSPGTHRGMQSVVTKLGTQSVPRLRLGIGSEEKIGPSEDFVLDSFAKDEKSLAEEVVTTAADGVMTYIYDGIQTAMNSFNKLDLARN
ncbi:MAG: Peptidyl-tRNA hydrolase [Candidatus Marinimicrobia bacterium]|nr:Peptidyl-tRNA hydrolase [Candidatus Neomarinimicrobiota bacterium]